MSKRWVRYHMPVMVEVECDDDEITRVVALPNEMHPARDDIGHFMIFDEQFIRRHGDAQPQVHAFCVAEPRWEHPRFAFGSPINWPDYLEWEQEFEMDEADERYAEINPYDTPRR